MENSRLLRLKELYSSLIDNVNHIVGKDNLLNDLSLYTSYSFITGAVLEDIKNKITDDVLDYIFTLYQNIILEKELLVALEEIRDNIKVIKDFNNCFLLNKELKELDTVDNKKSFEDLDNDSKLIIAIIILNQILKGE